MAVDLNWNLATAQPNMLALGNAGFQAGQQQAMQRREQQALHAYAANPDDAAPVNALLAINPQLAGQLMQGQRAARVDRQERDRQTAFRGAIRPDGSVDNNALGNAYLQSGDAKGYIEFQSQQRQAQKAELETQLKGVEVIGQLVGGVRDQASYDAGLARARQMGIDVSSLPPQFDPATVQRLQLQALETKDQLEQQWKQMGFDLDVAQFAETQRANRDSSARGWASVETARMNAASAGAGGGSGKPPSGYRWSANGGLEAIPGGPATMGGKLTEGQAKAGGFLRLAANAETTLSRLGGDRAVPGEVGRALYGVPLLERVVRGQDRQILAAQEAFAEASLRFLTGAAVTKDEARRNVMQFYPTPGDTSEVIQQKAGYRNELIEAMRTAAGPAAPRAASPTAQPAQPQPGGQRQGPRPGEVKNGYRFKGGDPAKPSSWQKL